MNAIIKQEIGVGVYHDLPNEAYHACKHAVSNSGLGDVLQSPFHYWARHLNPDCPLEREKAGQLEGTLAHCAILEPDQFEARYVVGPDCSRATKVWKEFAAQAEADGKTAIKPDQYEAAMRQGDSVRKNTQAAEVLAKGLPEVSAFWIDPETGVLCRCRPDWVHQAEGDRVILVDVKTYSDASPEEFARQVARKGYARQDAMYSEGYYRASGMGVVGFLFVAVESTYPFAASVVMLDDDSRDVGFCEYRRALGIYADCLKNNEWPGYSTGVEIIRLPNWKLAQNGEMTPWQRPRTSQN